MRFKVIPFLFILFFFSCVLAEDKSIRNPAVAGRFYPSNKKQLEKNIHSFIKNVPDRKVEGELISCMAPHAGYVYSGQVAAYTYKLLEKADFETIVIIGHDAPYSGIVAFLSEADFFRTPLGDVPVDKKMVKEIIAFSPRIISNEEIHSREHTVEVHLPFFQALKKKFKIVPILFGVPDEKNCKILANAILKASKGKKVMLLASTDLSHYPGYKDANKLDRSTLKVIEKLDVRLLFSHLGKQENKGIPNLSTAMCASGGVGTAIIFAKEKGANNVEILKYANSGDVSVGDKLSVVGYGALVISRMSEKKQTKGIAVKKETEKEVKKMAIDGKRVCMIIASRDFRDEEYQTPKAILLKAGIGVVTASSSLNVAKGMLGAKVKPDVLISDISVSDFDAIVFVGGVGSDEYWENETAHKIAKDTLSQGKFLCAICIAPVTLANAGVLSGKKVTSFSSVKGQLQAKGAQYTGNSVEVDGKIITAFGPDASGEFGQAIKDALEK